MAAGKYQRSELLAEAHALIMALHEEGLSPEQVQRLDELVCRYVEVRQLYVIHLHQRSGIAAMDHAGAAFAAEEGGFPNAIPALDDTMVVNALRPEGDDPTEESQELPPRRPSWASVDRELARLAVRRRTTYQLLIAAAVFLAVTAAAVLFVLNKRAPITRNALNHSDVGKSPATRPAVPQPLAPQPVYVATLTRQIDAVWRDALTQPIAGNGLEANTGLLLEKGFAELSFSSGAQVIVEAPAEFTVRSNAVILSGGKLAAEVPAPAHGFVVNTPQSTITDLGTELGVEAQPDGTEVSVFKGSVIAQTRDSTTQPVTLVEGKAASVTRAAIVLDPAGAVPQRFVRHLDISAESLDVVDLLGGGDGTTHHRGPAIDLQTGNYGIFSGRGSFDGDSAYRTVKLPALDGCFIPGGITKIDSAGDQYNFGSTRARGFDYIRAGGTFVWPKERDDPTFTSVLSGIDYGAQAHGFILLHANGGLTFNLTAIRRLCPEKTISAFRAVVGNTATQPRTAGSNNFALTNALVLVDGQVRFERQNFTNKDGPIPIEVPLHDTDRFLTLATTDPKSIFRFDWLIFGDPGLKLTDR